MIDYPMHDQKAFAYNAQPRSAGPWCMMDQGWLMDGFECRKPNTTVFVDLTLKEGSRRKYIERGYAETVTYIFLDALDAEGGGPAELLPQLLSILLVGCGTTASFPGFPFLFLYIIPTFALGYVLRFSMIPVLTQITPVTTSLLASSKTAPFCKCR
jgi:hypothetical protein